MEETQPAKTITAEQETRHRQVAFIFYFLAASLALITTIRLYTQLTTAQGVDFLLLVRLGIIVGYVVAARLVRRGSVFAGMGWALAM